MSQDARRDEELSTQHRARILNLNYADTSGPEKPLYRDVLPIADMKKLRVIPLKADKSNVLFGITNTTSQQTITMLKQHFLDQRLGFALISDSGFNDYIKLYDPPKQIVYQDIDINTAGTQDLLQRVSQTLNQVKADDMLAYLVEQAHKLAASDIHIEPQADYIRIRLRIDGVLHPIAHLNQEKYRILVSVIASGGNISTAADEAQQGHISQHLTMADGKTVDVNVRLETVPTLNGMEVVMRLFNMDQDMYNLDKLGLSEQERRVVDDIIHRPNGLVLAVGPTGSGKTTTLYSMLNSLNSEQRKIITIEDPVEYQFSGITQIPVGSAPGKESKNFADQLRAVLRLDPDIVMVGEIRDMDTAKTSLQAAVTGHLVLSTLHAGSAAAALTRLMDVIGQNPLFVSAIRLVMAQRLVRRLDDNTKQAYQPTQQEIGHIISVIQSLPEDIPKPDINNLQLYKPGSSDDNPYGFRGQIALREQFLMTNEIHEILKKGRDLSTEEIEQAAVQSGMRTMLQDGILKVCAGQTTLDEIYRVIG